MCQTMLDEMQLKIDVLERANADLSKKLHARVLKVAKRQSTARERELEEQVRIQSEVIAQLRAAVEASSKAQL